MAREFDPLVNFKFSVSIFDANVQAPTKSGTGGNRLGFRRVTGLNKQTDEIRYREGNWKLGSTFAKLPGLVNYGDVTMITGEGQGSAATFLMEAESMLNYVGPDGVTVDLSHWESFRKTVVVTTLDAVKSSGTSFTGKQWTLFQAWPKSVSISDLDAEGRGVIVKQVVWAHEGMRAADVNLQPAT